MEKENIQDNTKDFNKEEELALLKEENLNLRNALIIQGSKEALKDEINYRYQVISLLAEILEEAKK